MAAFKYIFSAKFNPMTKAHQEIIQELIDSYGKENVDVLIENQENDIDISTKFEMVSTVFPEATIKIVDGTLCDFYDENYKNQENIMVISGYRHYHDIDDELHRNGQENYDAHRYNFTIEPNIGILGKNKEFPMEIVPITSSDVRDRLSLNPEMKFQEISDSLSETVFNFIKSKNLYHQHSDNYKQQEQDFIQEYNDSIAAHNYPTPSNTATVVVAKGDAILLVRRKNFPYKDFWCLPGGFFELTDDSLEDTAARELLQETNISCDKDDFQLVGVWSKKDLDPRMRIIDHAYLVEVDEGTQVVAGDDEYRWFHKNCLPTNLAFHHSDIIEQALFE